MKGFIEIVLKDNNTILINVRYIEEVVELNERYCAICMANGCRYQLPLPYNRVVEMIKEAME